MTANCSFEEVDQLMKKLELVIYIPIFVVGLIFNIMALLVFCVRLRKWTESTIYMTNLVLMDLVLLFPLPFKMHATNHLWSANLHPLCSFLESLYFIGMYGSIYTIMCISVDRWLAIRHPFKAKQYRSCKVALGICIVVWLLVVAAVSPVYSLRSAGQRVFHCFHGFSNKSWSPGIIFCLEVFGFIVPALVLVCCSAQIIWTLKKSEQRSPKSRACVKIIYSSLCAFLIPFTPSHLAILLQFLVRQGVIEDCFTQTRISLFIQITLNLSNVTCCLDALCFYFIADEVKRSKNNFRRPSGYSGHSGGQRRETFSISEREPL